MMKNNIITLLAAVTLMFASCDALELHPTDMYGINDYWTSQTQIDRFLNGLHNRVRSRKHVLIQMGELRGGYLKPGPESTIGQGMNDLPIVSHNLSVQNPGLTNFGNFYMDIMQINHAIEQINVKVNFLNEKDKNYYLGALHGLRAFYYFHILRTWGGAPIADKADVLGQFDNIDKLNKKRATERETYNFVLQDINKSLDYYKEDNFTQMPEYKACFWTKQASYMLKAEVNLWGAKVKPIGENAFFANDPKAILIETRDLLLEIEGKTTLEDTQEKIFRVKDNNEIIYSIRFALNESGNDFQQFLYAPETFSNWFAADKVTPLGSDPLKAVGGSMRYEYKMDIYKQFEATDARRDFTFMYFCRERKEGRPPVVVEFIEAVCMRKFIGDDFSNIAKTQRQYVNDFPIYRKADLLLMLSEIFNELEDKINTKKYIEYVRKRAYGAKFGVAQQFTYTTKRAAEEAILLERDKEFVCEGKRWYDIRRMLNAEKALELCGNNPQKFLWPIAPGDLAKDPLLEQNEAYK